MIAIRSRTYEPTPAEIRQKCAELLAKRSPRVMRRMKPAYTIPVGVSPVEPERDKDL